MYDFTENAYLFSHGQTQFMKTPVLFRIWQISLKRAGQPIFLS